MSAAVDNAAARVDELLAVYGDDRACAAHLLCDRHPPQSVACTIVGSEPHGSKLTYAELKVRSERLASSLASLGLAPGDRVATLMGKSEALVVCLLAIWRLGAVHVPLFTAFAPPAISFRVTAAKARVVICDAQQLGKAREAETGDALVIVAGDVSAASDVLSFDDLMEQGGEDFTAVVRGGDAPLIQIYTSGTTGAPKGVHVPIRALASFHVYLEYGLDVRVDDVYWNAADPGWAYGLYYAIVAPLAAGTGTLLQTGGFSAEGMVQTLEDFGVTNFAAAPTVYRSLRKAGLKPKNHLRSASSAGEPLTPEVNAWSVEALGVKVRDHYGQTECGMLINNHQHPGLRLGVRPGSMGQAMPGWTPVVLVPNSDEIAAVGRAGSLAIDLRKSPLAWFSGYIDEPEKTRDKFASSGRWYFTGDSAKVDEDGFFYFASRDDDLIIMAGYRIGPVEVEAVILGHEAVAECAVVAAPDELRGEVLEAVVVLHHGYLASDVLTAEIQALVKTGFAAHAYPRRVHYVGALPITPSGKVQRFIVRQRLRELAQNAELGET
jgi:acetyl-CoA synthetase